uniref:Uncharacterized protein n=1 Tax=Amphimedon queenslandica TaxID=400682 RepID=A0A1X7VF74_AMPQE
KVFKMKAIFILIIINTHIYNNNNNMIERYSLCASYESLKVKNTWTMCMKQNKTKKCTQIYHHGKRIILVRSVKSECE